MSTDLTALAPTLDSIAAPLDATAFIERHWKREVFHAPGSPARLAYLLETIGPLELPRLLARSAQIAVTEAGPEPVPGPPVSIDGAMEAYARGATLYFRMREDFPVCTWTAELAAQLGELPIGVTSFFAVRGSGGTRLHLDANENFTVQLRGAKRWRVSAAPADFMVNPVTNWALGEPAPAFADAQRLPRAMPEGASTYLLEPGSLLYVPRGRLHEVASVDGAESLSLNLSLPPTPWATLLVTVLSNTLLERPALRASLTGAVGYGWGRDAALRELPAIVESFALAAAALGPRVREVLENPDKLADYLAKRRYPRL